MQDDLGLQIMICRQQSGALVNLSMIAMDGVMHFYETDLTLSDALDRCKLQIEADLSAWVDGDIVDAY